MINQVYNKWFNCIICHTFEWLYLLLTDSWRSRIASRWWWLKPLIWFSKYLIIIIITILIIFLYFPSSSFCSGCKCFFFCFLFTTSTLTFFFFFLKCLNGTLIGVAIGLVGMTTGCCSVPMASSRALRAGASGIALSSSSFYFNSVFRPATSTFVGFSANVLRARALIAAIDTDYRGAQLAFGSFLKVIWGGRNGGSIFSCARRHQAFNQMMGSIHKDWGQQRTEEQRQTTSHLCSSAYGRIR